MEDINVVQLKEKMDAGEDFYFIDVRETYEYAEDNLGAVNIPLGDIPSKIQELKDMNANEIIIHCRSGARSGTAKQFLVQAGLKNVRNVLGGILDYREKNGK
ncbi:UNVERIFIED_CONTAM: hypothetical protein GTU68_036593 [Idotea baltica]|nr:hypothetical protein [Idotea baltica]